MSFTSHRGGRRFETGTVLRRNFNVLKIFIQELLENLFRGAEIERQNGYLEAKARLPIDRERIGSQRDLIVTQSFVGKWNIRCLESLE